MAPPSADHLEHLAHLLLTSLADGVADLAIGVEPTPDGGLDLYVQPADGGDVVGLLIGMVAPPRWTAVGVVARGTARRFDRPRAAGPVTVCHLQGRDGACWSAVAAPGGDAAPRPTQGASGRLAEVCRRVMGLPSGAVAGPTLDWWVARWLSALVARPDPPASWREVAGAFPGGGPFGADLDEPAGLVAHGRLVAVCYPWEELRTACGSGLLDVPGVSPAEARWLDGPMFGCWARRALPTTAGLVELAARSMPGPLARQLRWTVRTWQGGEVG
jgi:hypothetical protein